MMHRGIKMILKKFRELLLGDVFYKGALYCTFNGNDNPNGRLPGTWERLPDGVFIRNAGGNADPTVGNLQKEGLPGITGLYSARELTEKDKNVYATGAFYDAGTHPNDKWNANGSNDGGSALIGFDASRSNKIYGASTHVTPVNVALYMWRRTK